MRHFIKIRFLFYFILVHFSMNCFSQEKNKVVELDYKQIDTVQLGLKVYYPASFQIDRTYPTIVVFFGGGWNGGTTQQFEPHALYFASKNLITVLVDYRVKSRHNTTPFESLKDAKSAIRYLRKNAHKLGIDANRIVGSGGSAGGHLAAACFTNESINEPTDDVAISAKPNALVLFNPVIDNGKDGYGFERIGERYVEFSPMHNIQKGFPPTIFFLGTKDNLIPVETAQKFKKKIEEVGSRCDLFLFENQGHGFFNKEPFLSETILKADAFLQSIDYLKP
ncbi:alpha/beta hydrolase [Runella aurantiaca]|uniref:Alpha/beta hydrolase n=1 Tax=Runella aurantiaca TaxID=2282308 RepID=A0A369IEV3_9BACT|nr:alpha/beta hydrolase [Runella aurantiaca]